MSLGTPPCQQAPQGACSQCWGSTLWCCGLCTECEGLNKSVTLAEPKEVACRWTQGGPCPRHSRWRSAALGPRSRIWPWQGPGWAGWPPAPGGGSWVWKVSGALPGQWLPACGQVQAFKDTSIAFFKIPMETKYERMSPKQCLFLFSTLQSFPKLQTEWWVWTVLCIVKLAVTQQFNEYWDTVLNHCPPWLS